jgi:hypothetical protein
MKHGSGRAFFEDGSIIKGVWKDDALDGPAEVQLWEEDDKPCYINFEKGDADISDFGICLFKSLVSKNMFRLANLAYNIRLSIF